jgi:hypothetical protein
VGKLALTLASCLLLTAVAGASVTADLDGGAPAAVSPGTSRYTYTMTLASDAMQAGDYFVLYDFYGYKPGSMTAPSVVNWTTDDNATTGPYPGAPTPDSPSVTNLLWTYKGSSISAVNSPVILGQFSADSSVPYTGRIPFAGWHSGVGSYYSSPFGPIATPEPSTAVLLAAGAAGLAWLHRRRSRDRNA